MASIVRNLCDGEVQEMKYVLVLGVMLALSGCFATTGKSPPQEITLNVRALDQPVEVAEETDSDGVHKSMQVRNPEGSLSNLSFICKDEAFVKIFSALTVSDVTNLWSDVYYLERMTNIRTINLFINSPGGDAFSGLALADQIERAKRNGFRFTAHASGIVASAAVPVFAVCNERLAAPGTIFMVHETAIWKWPGRETASDIRSQNRLMDLLRERYIEKLVQYSNLTREEWEELEHKTTWFSAEKGKSWDLVDRIE